MRMWTPIIEGIMAPVLFAAIGFLLFNFGISKSPDLASEKNWAIWLVVLLLPVACWLAVRVAPLLSVLVFLWRIRRNRSDRMSIIIAAIEGDGSTRALQKLLRDKIRSRFIGFADIVTWPRRINFDDGQYDRNLAKVNSNAFRLLKFLRCDMIVWGYKADNVIVLRITTADLGTVPPIMLNLNETSQNEFLDKIVALRIARVCSAAGYYIPEKLISIAQETMKMHMKGVTDLYDSEDLLGSYAALLKEIVLQTEQYEYLEALIELADSIEKNSAKWFSVAIELAFALSEMAVRTGNSRYLKRARQLEMSLTQQLPRWAARNPEYNTVLLANIKLNMLSIKPSLKTVEKYIEFIRSYLPNSSDTMSIAYSIKYQCTCDIDDLDFAIKIGLEALDFIDCASDPVAWVRSRVTLADMLRIRGEYDFAHPIGGKGGANGIYYCHEKAETILRRVLMRVGPNRMQREWVDAITNLSIVIYTRSFEEYVKEGGSDAQKCRARISEAISITDHALSIDCISQISRIRLMVNKGHALLMRAQVGNNLEELREVVKYYDDIIASDVIKKYQLLLGISHMNRGTATWRLARICGERSVADACRDIELAVSVYRSVGATSFEEGALRRLAEIEKDKREAPTPSP